MLVQLDPTSPEPLYRQLSATIRGAVVRGELEVGERLPAARELADALGINVHTVLKALGELRDEGVLELRRGRGAVVSSRPARIVELDDAVRRLLDAGQRHGLSLSQIHAAIDEGATS